MIIKNIDGHKVLVKIASTDLQDGAFTVPDGVATIGDDTFRGRSDLTSIIISGSVTTIGYSTLRGCTGLTSMTILDNVTTIGNGAFFGCTGLTSMTILGSVTTIGNCTFYGCIGLTCITISASVITIGYNTFDGCTDLTLIIIDTDDEAQVQRIRNLLPEKLRQFVISKKVYELKQNLLVNLCFTCPVNILRGVQKLNDAALNEITSFEERPEDLALKRALEEAPITLGDFSAYKIVLERIVERHVIAYKLQNYIQILEKTAPSAASHGEPKARASSPW